MSKKGIVPAFYLSLSILMEVLEAALEKQGSVEKHGGDS